MINPIVLTGIFELGNKIFDKLFPNPAAAAAAKLELLKLQQSGELEVMANETSLIKAQLTINAEEAKHASIFVSGWRPATGWCCALALAYAAIVEPIARLLATMYGYTGGFPAIDTTITMQILLGMLGLAGARSFEKFKNIAAK